eukprot:1763810-Prymnesium_polylepis.1
MPPIVPQNVNHHDACLSKWTTLCNQPWPPDSKCAWFAAGYTKTLTHDFGITNRSVLNNVAAATSCVEFFRTWEAACISAHQEHALKASHSCPSFAQKTCGMPRDNVCSISHGGSVPPVPLPSTPHTPSDGTRMSYLSLGVIECANQPCENVSSGAEFCWHACHLDALSLIHISEPTRRS